MILNILSISCSRSFIKVCVTLKKKTDKVSDSHTSDLGLRGLAAFSLPAFSVYEKRESIISHQLVIQR